MGAKIYFGVYFEWDNSSMPWRTREELEDFWELKRSDALPCPVELVTFREPRRINVALVIPGTYTELLLSGYPLAIEEYMKERCRNPRQLHDFRKFLETHLGCFEAPTWLVSA
jgi:hypothetical protein